MIYLDNAATTEISDEVLNEMMPYLKGCYANPGAIYSSGVAARRAIEEAREKVAAFFKCNFDQVIFTSGGSEGNNFVISGTKPFLSMIGKKKIISSLAEHESVIKSVRDRYLFDGYECKFLQVTPAGNVDLSNLEKEVDDKSGLVSLMYVNNETGVLNNVCEIGRLCNENGTLFHTDCVQAAGDIQLDVRSIGCDYATISSHKIHGPKGIGAVYAKDKNTLRPIICGGDEQEFGLRGGTENVANIVGFGKACEISMRDYTHNSEKIITLKNAFVHNVIEKIPGVFINGNPDMKSKIVSVSIPGIDAQSLVISLGDRVAISAGSACCAHSNSPSHVLKAMGIDDTISESTIRVSFSFTNSLEEVNSAVDIIAEEVDIIRHI